MGLENDYCAYCFDEACMFLYQALKEGKKLKLKGDKPEKENKPKHYSSIGEFYKALGVR